MYALVADGVLKVGRTNCWPLRIRQYLGKFDNVDIVAFAEVQTLQQASLIEKRLKGCIGESPVRGFEWFRATPGNMTAAARVIESLPGL